MDGFAHHNADDLGEERGGRKTKKEKKKKRKGKRAKGSGETRTRG